MFGLRAPHKKLTTPRLWLHIAQDICKQCTSLWREFCHELPSRYPKAIETLRFVPPQRRIPNDDLEDIVGMPEARGQRPEARGQQGTSCNQLVLPRSKLDRVVMT
ncbi:hypothetical protein RRG08_004312 [Elysia crispata]|uniref:Uncharacterized protein n=1 Tax=Elysia crispata TaxID=231223 RepID=A0AAE0YD14_9GAST|nr:hypothetical protein RRG08_004312 [Elysia crispata]